MKQTDYAPRAAVFDTYLKGRNLRGAEVGCDVGAHAHAMLKYCSIQMLFLIDIWTREFYQGYCEGRLFSHGYKNNVQLIKASSENAAKDIQDNYLDFVYIDIGHDYETVKRSLVDWYPKLKPGGILGYRNYAESANPGLTRAVDEFVATHELTMKREGAEVIIYKPSNE